MLAHDGRVLDVPSEKIVQPRNADLIAWAKAILRVSHQCVRDALAQVYTGNKDIRTDLSGTAVVESTTATLPTIKTAPLTSTARTHVPLLALRKHFRHVRIRIAMLSADITHSPVLSWVQ
jgi:hypothetical protein